ncbi:hypothetical protein EYW45_08785 [Achromobacter sp. KS-M25]|nr:hypothetical protein [Achromobacter aestuarii]
MRGQYSAFTFAVVLAVVSFVAPGTGWARNCKTGQPCGNSCISWSKTCRIGSGSFSGSYNTAPAALAAPAATAVSKVVPVSKAPPREAGALEQQRTLAVDGAAFEWPDFEAPVAAHIAKGSKVSVYSKHREWIRISPDRTFPIQWVPGSVLVAR